MENPYLAPERFMLPTLTLIFGCIKTALNKRLHPILLFCMQGKEKMIYIENDKETIMITIERRLKPKMGITKSDLQTKP